MDVNSWRKDAGNYLDFTFWTFFKYCTCGGTPRFKYKSITPGYELWVMPVRNKFSVFKGGPALINGAPITDIKERLKQVCSTN